MAETRICHDSARSNPPRTSAGQFGKRHIPLPIGTMFDRLTVIGDETRLGKKYWVTCQCDCGVEVRCDVDQLKRGKKKQCGGHARVISAQQKAAIGARRKTHGRSRTPEYSAWVGMKMRCYNPADSRYADYGGRGITVYPEWIGSFEAFLSFIGDRPGCDYSLDRIDVDGDYTPCNVRWADASTQTRNRRPFVIKPGSRRSLLPLPEPMAYVTPTLKDGTAHGNATHGMCRTPEYQAWTSMRKRCNNPNHPAYRNYGGRGITVADEWQNDFVAFLAEVGMKPHPSYSLDRIDNRLGYVPGNIRWSDACTQNRNRRAFVMVSAAP